MAKTPMRIAVVLSGCGVRDGSEIHEAVCTLLAISREGAEAVCFAPNIDQKTVISHLTGKRMNERRNVLVESARIARGRISDLASFDANDVDAIIFPGGAGAERNLCDFDARGPDCAVEPSVERAVLAMHAAGKPIGALCIAPVLLARLFGGDHVELTIGDDSETAKSLETLGARHHRTTHGGIVVDARLKVVTSPGYMLNATVAQIADGATNTVRALIRLAEERRTAVE